MTSGGTARGSPSRPSVLSAVSPAACMVALESLSREGHRIERRGLWPALPRPCPPEAAWPSARVQPRRRRRGRLPEGQRDHGRGHEPKRPGTGRPWSEKTFRSKIGPRPVPEAPAGKTASLDREVSLAGCLPDAGSGGFDRSRRVLARPGACARWSGHAAR